LIGAYRGETLRRYAHHHSSNISEATQAAKRSCKTTPSRRKQRRRCIYVRTSIRACYSWPAETLHACVTQVENEMQHVIVDSSALCSRPGCTHHKPAAFQTAVLLSCKTKKGVDIHIAAGRQS
jgi:hypothetical protein